MSYVTDETGRKHRATLTPRQQKFCEYYAACGNAYESAKLAGYNGSHGASIMRSPVVKARIEELQAPIREQFQITRERVLEEIARLAFSDMGDYAEWGPNGIQLKDHQSMTPAQRAAVQELNQSVTKDGGSIRFKLHDKMTALEKLGKYLNLFTDRVSIESGNPLLAAVAVMSDDQVAQLQDQLERRALVPGKPELTS